MCFLFCYFFFFYLIGFVCFERQDMKLSGRSWVEGVDLGEIKRGKYDQNVLHKNKLTTKKLTKVRNWGYRGDSN